MSLELIGAVKAGDAQRAEELIKSGEDINQQDEQGWTSLNFAAGSGNLPLVKLLVENGADLSKTGRDGRTPYLIALAAGRVEVARYLREMEDKTLGEKSARHKRSYCKAYRLADLRKFPGWSESISDWNSKPEQADEELTDQSVVFLHQDLTVTQSMWHNENVIFSQVTPEWEKFCADDLQFRVPDDLDLIAAAGNASQS